MMGKDDKGGGERLGEGGWEWEKEDLRRRWDCEDGEKKI
jgi:hypothetical protein